MPILILLGQRFSMRNVEIMLEQFRDIHQWNATHLIEISGVHELFTLEFKLKTVQGDRNIRII